jgi:hypothetical protein
MEFARRLDRDPLAPEAQAMPNNLTPPHPAPQMRELAYLVGKFECQGEVLDSPLSARHHMERSMVGKLDLDGHWLVMRHEDLGTPEHPQPIRGNWQFTFDRTGQHFSSVWTDNFGRCFSQRSPGWEDNSLAFTGTTPMSGRLGNVRDVFVKRSADEMSFLVDYQIDGVWARVIELVCTRAKTG